MVTFLENDPNKDFKLYIKIAQLSLERTTSCRLNIQCLFLKRGGGEYNHFSTGYCFAFYKAEA